MSHIKNPITVLWWWTKCVSVVRKSRTMQQQ